MPTMHICHAFTELLASWLNAMCFKISEFFLPQWPIRTQSLCDVENVTVDVYSLKMEDKLLTGLYTDTLDDIIYYQQV